MSTITNIKSEFDQFVPVIKAQVVEHFNASFDRFEKEYGKVGTYRGNGAWDHGRREQSRLHAFAKFEHGGSTGRSGDPMVRNPERIDGFAQKCAEDQVAGFVAKLEKKLCDLTDCEVVDVKGPSFVIRGNVGNRHVVVRQDIILKRSSKGTLFNQFPARIYVDGKFTPESKFKGLGA
jgi:hypothetical protein